MDRHRIRNFCIIAHIDHGKSTLADRLLEKTHTVEARKMKEQYLDKLDLERERGITIKMAPVRMQYTAHDVVYTLNLIDTPGHSDFGYEVSRALAAVEGAVLLVDGKQGIQAQTLANLRAAREAGLTVIGVINKIDLFPDTALLDSLREEVATLLDTTPNAIYLVSGKTGAGVDDMLHGIIEHIPEPSDSNRTRALIFDSFYDSHKGVVAYVRMFGGTLERGARAMFITTGEHFTIKELGYFAPELIPLNTLMNGDIGYIATGIKNPEHVRIGDTVTVVSRTESVPTSLPGYREPKPVVFVSFYPEQGDAYESLGQGLQRLRLNDAALVIEQDRNTVLGRGFKVGFLGKLHYEIIAERLQREFNIATIQTFPSVRYRIKTPRGWIEIVRPEELPEDSVEIWEPMVRIDVLLPPRYLNAFLSTTHRFRMIELTTNTVGSAVEVSARMPLIELISDFDDTLKSLSEGFGSFSYEFDDYARADVVKVDIAISGDVIPGISRFLARDVFEREGRVMVERLKALLPRQQYVQPIQAKVQGRIIARETIAAMRKNVTGHLYGGDRTRKMKLWQKQKRGKKKLQRLGKAHIDPKVFKELLKK